VSDFKERSILYEWDGSGSSVGAAVGVDVAGLRAVVIGTGIGASLVTEARYGEGKWVIPKFTDIHPFAMWLVLNQLASAVRDGYSSDVLRLTGEIEWLKKENGELRRSVDLYSSEVTGMNNKIGVLVSQNNELSFKNSELVAKLAIAGGELKSADSSLGKVKLHGLLGVGVGVNDFGVGEVIYEWERPSVNSMTRPYDLAGVRMKVVGHGGDVEDK
jgi:hypothetical protein